MMQSMHIVPGQTKLSMHPLRENADPQAGPYF